MATSGGFVNGIWPRVSRPETAVINLSTEIRMGRIFMYAEDYQGKKRRLESC